MPTCDLERRPHAETRPPRDLDEQAWPGNLVARRAGCCLPWTTCTCPTSAPGSGATPSTSTARTRLTSSWTPRRATTTTSRTTWSTSSSDTLGPARRDLRSAGCRGRCADVHRPRGQHARAQTHEGQEQAEWFGDREVGAAGGARAACLAASSRQRGGASVPRCGPAGGVGADEVVTAVEALDRLARSWHALPVGGRLRLAWPWPERRARPAS